jgi:hypothetical protein
MKAAAHTNAGMCRRVTCSKCGKPDWRGCGAHVEQVLGDVPQSERCHCREKAATARRTNGPPPARSWIRRWTERAISRAGFAEATVRHFKCNPGLEGRPHAQLAARRVETPADFTNRFPSRRRLRLTRFWRRAAFCSRSDDDHPVVVTTSMHSSDPHQNVDAGLRRVDRASARTQSPRESHQIGRGMTDHDDRCDCTALRRGVDRGDGARGGGGASRHCRPHSPADGGRRSPVGSVARIRVDVYVLHGRAPSFGIGRVQTHHCGQNQPTNPDID